MALNVASGTDTFNGSISDSGGLSAATGGGLVKAGSGVHVLVLTARATATAATTTVASGQLVLAATSGYAMHRQPGPERPGWLEQQRHRVAAWNLAGNDQIAHPLR